MMMEIIKGEISLEQKGMVMETALDLLGENGEMIEVQVECHHLVEVGPVLDGEVEGTVGTEDHHTGHILLVGSDTTTEVSHLLQKE